MLRSPRKRLLCASRAGYLFFAIALSCQSANESANDGGRASAAVSISTAEWTPATATLVGPDHGSYTFALASQPAHGWVSLTGSSLTYYPEPYFNGTDSFEYSATGDRGATTASVAITVRKSSAIADGDGVTLSDSAAGAIAPKQIDFTEQTYTSRVGTFPLDRAAFCRLFYDPNIGGSGTEGLWLTASTKNSDYGDGYFMVKGLDLNLNAVPGTERTLIDASGRKIRASGDSHHATDGRFYYAAAGGCGNTMCSGGDGHGAIYQFDRDWKYVAEYAFDFDRKDYRSNDMLFAYANRKVFFGITYFPNCGEEPDPNCASTKVSSAGGALYAYAPGTSAFSDAYRLGNDPTSPMGGTLAYDGSSYWLIGNESGPNALAAQRYDSLSSSKVKSVALTNDGQWAQGAFFDGGRLFIAYHSGAHGYGDVNLVVWDKALAAHSNTILVDADQTGDIRACAEGSDPFSDDDDCAPANCKRIECNGTGRACSSCSLKRENAQRPHLARVRDTLFYTYDFADQTFTATEQADGPDGHANWLYADHENKVWECRVGAVVVSATQAGGGR